MTALRTRAVRAGVNCDPGHGAVIAPIQVSSAFRRVDPAQPGAFDYARTDQPGRAELAGAIASLEGALGGVVTSSGMAAIDLILNLLPNNARIICTHDCYGGTRRLFDARAHQRGFDVFYVDCTDNGVLSDALKDGADLVFLETPSNPRLRVTDLKSACAMGKAAGALVAVDNTLLSPALQRPVEHGADLVVNSLTKMLNGHSDMVGGAVCAIDADILQQLCWWANAAGAVGGAFDAFLALRGLRTLSVRAFAQSNSAGSIAARLHARPDIARVDYPGLVTHPGHAVAKSQQDGFGGLLSLELKGGVEAAQSFVQSLQLFTLAQSLGGVESLCNIPATMTHAAMTAEARHQAGIGDGLVRVSVGLEALDDLWADIESVLDQL